MIPDMTETIRVRFWFTAGTRLIGLFFLIKGGIEFLQLAISSFTYWDLDPSDFLIYVVQGLATPVIGIVFMLFAPRLAHWFIRIPDASRCPGCRYRIEGLTSPRCPECGLTLPANFLTSPSPSPTESNTPENTP